MVSGKLQETGKGGFEPIWQEQWELEGGSMENQIMEDRQFTETIRKMAGEGLTSIWVKSENEDAEKVGKLGTERKAQAGTISELGNWECKGGDTETASQGLKGSGKKTHSCSYFPFLLIDTVEIETQEDGTEQKREKLERGPRKEIKNDNQKKERREPDRLP